MKKICILLALLLCLGACGTGVEPPTEKQATTTEITTEETTTAATTTFQEMTSDEILEEIFQPAIDMYIALTIGGLSCDSNDIFEYTDGEEDNRCGYARVTDPRFPTLAAIETAVREIFSEELTQSFFNLLSPPTLMEREGKLYTADRSRGGRLSIESIRVDSQSDKKVVYILHAISFYEGEEDVSKEYTYTRELINGKWVFATFPMEWL